MRSELQCLIRAVQAGDPRAAPRLRDLLEPGVRLLLRKRIAHVESAKQTVKILNEVVRLVESHTITDIKSLTSTVRMLMPASEGLPCDGVPIDPRLVSVARQILEQCEEKERNVLLAYYTTATDISQLCRHYQISKAAFHKLRSRILWRMGLITATRQAETMAQTQAIMRRIG